MKAWTERATLHLAPKGVLYFASAPLLEDRFSEVGLGRVDITGAMALRRLLHEHPTAQRLVVHRDASSRAPLLVCFRRRLPSLTTRWMIISAWGDTFRDRSVEPRLLSVVQQRLKMEESCAASTSNLERDSVVPEATSAPGGTSP